MVAATMRAIAIDRFGGPEVLRLAELPRPLAAAGEVLIRVTHAGVNPADWKCREGWLSAYFQYRFPFVLGFDLAGIVEHCGEGVDGLAPGQRVVAYSRQGLGEWGSYAEYAVASAEAVVLLPTHFDGAAAAALPTAGITAYEALFESGQLRARQKLLVHGGAGGVGSYAIQLARDAGADVAATCGPSNLDYVRSLGASLAIDYHKGRIAEAVAAWAPEGVDLLVDAVGQGSLPAASAMIRPGGVLAPIATLIAGEVAHDAVLAADRGVRILPTMSNYQRSAAQLSQLVALSSEGRLRPPPLTVLPLAQAAEAQRRVQAGHVRGKLILAVTESD